MFHVLFFISSGKWHPLWSSFQENDPYVYIHSYITYLFQVKNLEDKNWYEAELNGRKGFIPATYIQMERHE